MNINRRGLLAAAAAVLGITQSIKAPRASNPNWLRAYPNKGRRLSQADLDQAVALHAAWLEDPTTGRHADLTNADLSGLTLSRVSLEGADLSGANLTETVFEDVDLNWARFVGSDLTHATLVFCSLVGTNFSNACLNKSRILSLCWENHGEGRAKVFENVCFRQANLTGAQIYGVLDGVNFRGANLIAANLSGSSFRYCNFVGADLTAANLTETESEVTNYSSAILRNTNLSAASMVESSLNGADLTKACLTGAYLLSNRLNDLKLSQADLRCAYVDQTFDGQDLMFELSGPGHLGCRVEGAVINGKKFEWPRGPKPKKYWLDENHLAYLIKHRAQRDQYVAGLI